MKLHFNLDQQKKFLVGLSFAVAVLLGVSFPPFPIGVTACIGFVPFLLLVDNIHSFGRFFRYSYSAFFVFSLLTLYWVGGYTHLKDLYLMFAGGALLLWQPIFFTLPASVYYFVRKRIPHQYSVWSFPFIWITFEWLYALGEFAFPWLTIGNTQTYHLEKIQFADVTGVYGISLWVLIINIVIFFLLKSILSNSDKSKSVGLTIVVLVLYILPNFYSLSVNERDLKKIDSSSFTVGIVQPNVDPWDKWEGANSFQGRWNQSLCYLELIKREINDSVDIVVLPESAILLNLPSFNEQYSEFRRQVDSLDIAIISGYARVKYYDPDSAPASSSTIKGTNIRYDSFNSIFLVEPGMTETQSYSKMRLVPFAERIPYADEVPFLIEPLRWGVGISNWGLGNDSTVFSSKKVNAKFLAMVCYESIFPEFVASFVNKGAEFLVFVTNDSWWGNTSGARQHQQYAVLRAIENRRWVVRCANGGISSFIDPYGTTYDKTEMYVQDYIQRTITPRKEKTFYSVHGDWIARISASIALLIFLFSIGYPFLRKQI
ncbi:MAG: apolipoprotein N-acyltransferase [Bacteroidota bacterium]